MAYLIIKSCYADERINTANKITRFLRAGPKLKSIFSFKGFEIFEPLELPLMILEYHAINDALTWDPSYKGLGIAEQFNYHQFGQKTPITRAIKSNAWKTFLKGLKSFNNPVPQ